MSIALSQNEQTDMCKLFVRKIIFFLLLAHGCTIVMYKKAYTMHVTLQKLFVWYHGIHIQAHQDFKKTHLITEEYLNTVVDIIATNHTTKPLQLHSNQKIEVYIN